MTRPTGKEVFFDKNELIVSKTNLKGQITYANDIFVDIAGYTMDEVIGKPHNMIRHPHMPRCIFKMLWDTLQSGSELFAYVMNMTKNGNHYWVLAHVTPSFDTNNNIIGYHSTRRVPNPKIIQGNIIPLYNDLKKIEDAPSSKKDGLENSEEKLLGIMKEKNTEYDEFISSLSRL